jgi:hypothetical protein
MIGSAFDLGAVVNQASERARQFKTVRIKDRKVKQARAAGRRRRRTFAGPGVERDVMVVTARRKKRRLSTAVLRDLEPERVAVETHGALEV